MGNNNNKKISNKSKLFNWLIGPYKEIYTGYAVDEKLRYECSSGGVATALLKYLIETKVMDGAIVAAPIRGKPLRHQAHYVNKVEDIVQYKGSIYCPIDYSPTWQIIEENHGRRLVIIGQPCQLRAVDQFVSAKGLDASKIFKIGLFCGGVTSYKALEYLCKKAKVKPKDALEIRYRSGGWPGRKMVIVIRDAREPTKTKEIVLFDRDASFSQKYLYDFCFSGPFFLDCCRVCKDQTSEHADISLGDAWLPEITSADKLGTNLIMARTDRGYKILQGAVNSGVIKLEGTDPEDVINSQGNCLIGKKLGLWGKPFWKYSSDTSEFKISKRYIPQHVPSKRIVLERRLFQWLVAHFPAHPIFMFYVTYNLAFLLIKKFGRTIIKIFK